MRVLRCFCFLIEKTATISVTAFILVFVLHRGEEKHFPDVVHVGKEHA